MEGGGLYNLTDEIEDSSQEKSDCRNDLYEWILKCDQQRMDFLFGFRHILDLCLGVVDRLLNVLRQLHGQYNISQASEAHWEVAPGGRVITWDNFSAR